MWVELRPIYIGRLTTDTDISYCVCIILQLYCTVGAQVHGSLVLNSTHYFKSSYDSLVLRNGELVIAVVETIDMIRLHTYLHKVNRILY